MNRTLTVTAVEVQENGYGKTATKHLKVTLSGGSGEMIWINVPLNPQPLIGEDWNVTFIRPTVK